MPDLVAVFAVNAGEIDFPVVAAIVVLDLKMPEDGKRIRMRTERDGSVIQPLNVVTHLRLDAPQLLRGVLDRGSEGPSAGGSFGVSFVTIHPD